MTDYEARERERKGAIERKKEYWIFVVEYAFKAE